MPKKFLAKDLGGVSRQSLVLHFTNMIKNFESFPIASVFDKVNRQYYRERPLTKDTGTKNKDLVVPLVMSQVDSTRAYLHSIFAAKDPMFQVVSSEKDTSSAGQLNALILENSRHRGWKRNLSLCILDGLKYSVFAAEWKWSKDISTIAAPALPNAKDSIEVKWEGNEIKHLDMYNTFWDLTCNPSDVHIHGDYVGYHELVSLQRLKTFIKTLDSDYVLQNVLNEHMRSSAGQVTANLWYKTASINKDSSISNPELAAMNFGPSHFTGTESKYKDYKNSYQLTTIYARIIPAIFNMQVASPNSPQIWKFLLLDGLNIIYAEPVDAAHEYFPIIIGQLKDEGLGLDAESFAESLVPLQNLASDLWAADIKSTQRVIGDRALYDPLKIKPKDINSTSPVAKIPIRNLSMGQTIAGIFQQIPYTDPALGTRTTQASQVIALANQVSGSNSVRQGQFVPGNKTNDQFAASMSGSSARELLLATSLQEQFIIPGQQIFLSNYLQYQQARTIYDTTIGNEINISPEQLKNASLVFTVADGLTGADKLASSEFAGTLLQIISSDAELGLDYDKGAIIADIASTQNVRNLNKYKLSEEQKKAKIAQIQQMQAQVPTK